MDKLTKHTIEVIVEREKKHFWARVEGKGNFMPTGQGVTIDKTLRNVKDAISDYIEHEGIQDKFWMKVDVSRIQFDIHYDLQSFFEEFNELKISSIATRSGLNESLVRQYATGKKYPSAEQAKKIENAIHDLAKRLEQVSIFA